MPGPDLSAVFKCSVQTLPMGDPAWAEVQAGAPAELFPVVFNRRLGGAAALWEAAPATLADPGEISAYPSWTGLSWRGR